MLCRLVVPILIAVSLAQTPQVDAFAAPVASLPREGKCLIVVVDGLINIVHITISVTDVAEVDGLTALVAAFAGDFKRLFEIGDGLIEPTRQTMGDAEIG